MTTTTRRARRAHKQEAGGIPEGPASKKAQAVAALLALISAYTAIKNGDHSAETLVTGGAALVVFLGYMAGRYTQAVAKLRQGTPDVTAQVDVDTGGRS